MHIAILAYILIPVVYIIGDTQKRLGNYHTGLEWAIVSFTALSTYESWVFDLRFAVITDANRSIALATGLAGSLFIILLYSYIERPVIVFTRPWLRLRRISVLPIALYLFASYFATSTLNSMDPNFTLGALVSAFVTFIVSQFSLLTYHRNVVKEMDKVKLDIVNREKCTIDELSTSDLMSYYIDYSQNVSDKRIVDAVYLLLHDRNPAIAQKTKQKEQDIYTLRDYFRLHKKNKFPVSNNGNSSDLGIIEHDNKGTQSGNETANESLEAKGTSATASNPDNNIQGVNKYTDSVGTKQCPKCAEIIRLEAKLCRFCRYEFDKSEVQAAIESYEKHEAEENRRQELRLLMEQESKNKMAKGAEIKKYGVLKSLFWILTLVTPLVAIFNVTTMPPLLFVFCLFVAPFIFMAIAIVYAGDAKKAKAEATVIDNEYFRIETKLLDLERLMDQSKT